VTSDAQGKYLFNKVLPGKYDLSISIPSAYTPTKFSKGENRNLDSNLPENGRPFTIEIAESVDDRSIDFGLIRLGNIGDLVWEDLNCDKQRQLNEPGLAGVSVVLSGRDIFDNEVNSLQVTDALGHYNFSSLKPGTYTVTITTPQGFESTESLVRVITISSGSLIENIDIPFFKRTSVGDFVWDDVNGNGIQDTGELGISGVSVTLSGVSDAIFAPVATTTNVSGQYKFDNLKPGVYTLRFGDIADYRFADRKAGNEVTKDSDVDNSGVTGNIDLVSGSPRTDVDAGYVSTSTASVSDFVWEDLNGDGLQDTGEPGISGVTVTLDGMSTSGKNITKSVVTDGGGKYKIDSLPEGQYRVTFSSFTGYFFTKSLGIEESRNSDANEVTGQTSVINLQKGQRLETIDAGLYRRTSVGDFVWDDVNGNGIQDTGELGLSGVSVTLSGVSDATFASVTTTTNVSGQYKFENLKPGVYTLRFGDIADYRFADRKAGNEVTKDSDVDNSGVTGNIDLVSGSPRTDVDAGYVSTSIGSVSDFVWEDLNGDGLQDTGEPGISGVTVTLDGMSTSGKNITKSVVTDGGGKYKIDSLPDGQYRVTFSILPGYFFTKSLGIEESRNSDANEVTGQTSVINLQKGQRLETIDAGLYRRTSVGDFVWDDVNGNGIQDTGELGISGVSVTLSGVSDVTFASVTTTTNVTGHYKFENLKPGVYTLRFGDIADYRFADRKAGNEVTKDSDVDNSGVTGNIDLVSGSPRTDIDAGYVSTSIGSVSDFVWEDLNGDGLQDTGEPGISGVTVTLDGMSTSGKNITKSVVTDGGGKYKIDSLPDGQYRVTFSILPGYFFTKSIGIEESRNSDANEVTGQTSVINLQKGQRLETIDAGLYRRTSVGDFVWDDVNGNGIQDTGELGLSGVSVTLSGVSDATFASVTTTTNVSGQYKFENLKPGVYNIVFGQVALKNLTSPKVGADDGKDSDPVLGGHVSNVTLVSGVHRNDIDAGYVPISTASIRGFVWEDLNANGVQDAGEPGISNDTVSLKREDGNFSGGLVTVISDQNGRYIFSNLAAGSYTVIFGRPSGFEFTDNDRGDDAFDSDALAPAGKTSVFTIGSGQSLLNIDAGLFRRGSLGDFVWNDSNGNGLQEASESGLSGIMLTLKDETNSVIGSTNSDINGKYLFSNIKPAKYKIEAVLPKGYTSVPINPQDLTLNSDFYPSDSLANTALITVLSGIQNLDIDLGIVIKSRISGIVWKDSIGNGLREEIEPMMGSVVVILLNSTGSELKRDTTDSNGAYLFKDIEAGTYKVKFAIMPGMFFTYPNVGSNDSKSSDVIDQSGVTSEFLVMEGLDMANVCAGYVNSSSIGDYIWIDENKNGLQSSDEVGLNGVKIYLLNQLGIVIDSTTSNISNSGSGYYSFSNLIYGQYSVKFSLPANFDFTMLNSSDTLLNSDIVDAATGKTSTLTLLPGQMRKDVDAGYTLKAAVTGTINGIVWQDNNNNKFRDGADSLLSGITVSLFKRDRTLVATTLSGPDGSYLFSQVAFGDYFVSVPSISEKMFVLKQGNPVQNGSQISNFFGAGSTDLISVLPGSTVSGIDLGYSRKITIGDFVWDDLNNNGLQDTNEPGIGNIIISLINEAGVIEKTTTSNDSGQYTISDIGPGRYKIKFSSKSDYVFAKLNSTDDGKNSKVNPTNGETPLLDFLTLITYTNIDAGYTKAGSVGSRVWLDLNGNGIFQSNEPGIPDIKIKLYSEDGSLADSTTTGQDGTSLFSGFYTFSKVRPGKYYIKFEIPLTYIISVPDVGGDEDVDCDITATFGPMTTDLFEVSGHQFVKNIDAGAYRPATIGDRVWNDLNMNGIQESGEPGVANVKVSLYNQSGILLDTTRTNGQGIYSFMNLRQRLYYLQFSLPDGFQFTIQNAPGTNEDDSDVDNTGTTPLISLAHGSNLLQIDAGIFRSSARIVMGKVWKDGNEDGICNTGETYETGVKVYLKDLATGEVKSSITNHAGRYALITNNVGEHHVVVEAPEDFVFTEKGMGNDNESDSDVNELGISDVLMLTDQYAMKYIDAGYYYKVVSSLNGKVWKDKNNNGLRDDTDSLMQNVVVFLFDKSRIFVKSTKTNSAGEYSFKFLDAGQYYCRIPEFSDMSFVMFTGNNQEKDSEITNQFGVGTSRLITIDPGTPFNNFDFGYVDLNRLVVSDPKRIVQYEVFPNPVINEIRVKVPLDILMKTQYNIINNVGMVVKSGTIDGESEILETGHLPSGRYVIQFFNEKEMILKTFIKVDN
jgi:protocatechuate 3,4-dioxygenase beta subunit